MNFETPENYALACEAPKSRCSSQGQSNAVVTTLCNEDKSQPIICGSFSVAELWSGSVVVHDADEAWGDVFACKKANEKTGSGDKVKVALSLVIPALNEARRLPHYLEMVRGYAASARAAGPYAVIIVDDGSTDGLSDVLAEWTRVWPELRVIRYPSNQGKGAALRTGTLEARGDHVLFADADGATPIQEEAVLRRAIEEGADIAVGSRLAWGKHSCLPRESDRHECSPNVERSWLRNLTGASFAWAVRRMFELPVRDTQCGFKMFRREVAQRLFAMCREDGFLIDVEVLLYAHRLGYKIVEVPVSWRDVPDSKVRLFRDGWRMLTGLRRLRRRMRAFDLTTGGQRHSKAKAEEDS